ncbi:MAG: hypothetical protein H0U70_03710 [Tatlockia sp.]|nr:hypothetical protein [Tatlockia sp.]
MSHTLLKTSFAGAALALFLGFSSSAVAAIACPAGYILTPTDSTTIRCVGVPPIAVKSCSGCKKDTSLKTFCWKELSGVYNPNLPNCGLVGWPAQQGGV